MIYILYSVILHYISLISVNINVIIVWYIISRGAPRVKGPLGGAPRVVPSTRVASRVEGTTCIASRVGPLTRDAPRVEGPTRNDIGYVLKEQHVEHKMAVLCKGLRFWTGISKKRQQFLK